MIALSSYRYQPKISDLYTWLEQGSDTVQIVLEPETPVATHKDLGDSWPLLCQDEVFSLKPLEVKKFRALYLPEKYLQELAVRAVLEPHDMAIFTY